MTLHLKEMGISDDQILEMNFESYSFRNMNSDSFYEYVKQHIILDKRMYLSLMKFSVLLTGKMQSTLSCRF
ncbi:MAG: hypothetical protein ACLTDF_02240 [Coprococcus sp.]